MDGIRVLGLCPAARVIEASIVVGILLVLTATGLRAQGVVESNINVTGIGAPGYDVGQPGKQENEPSCAINPLNELNVMCAYNWYGFADLPQQGDTWIGFSETRDGRVFIRRPLTGTRNNNWTGQDFAADPTMLAWPGGAAVTSIAGVRGGNSVMLIQRMMELNTETGFRHVSESGQIEIAAISGVNFIDKPDARVVIDPNGGTQSVTMTLETGETVTREWPKFRIIVTYAVFNGSSQNIRTYSTYSDGFGAAGSWSNPRQITNSSGLDQGLSVANIGNEILYTVRRFQAGTERDSVMGAISKNRGQQIGKVFEITDICAFDQVTLPNSAITQEAVSFRTNDFPWVSATGDTYVLVYSERPRDLAGNCVFDQGTRIMVRSSQDGKNWSDPAVEVSPVAGHAFQFMPALTCARGSCQVLWYDTRNESAAFTAALQPELSAGAPAYWENNPFIEDFIIDDQYGSFSFRRTADVYTSRINIAANGDPLPSAQPERVSVYQLGVDQFNNVFEREFNPLNVRNYAANTQPFMGDYIAMAAPQWRLKDDGISWESNQSPVGIEELDKVNYFGAWTDNRRVRGSSILAYPYSEPTPFSVSSEVTSSTDDKDTDELPAESEPGGPLPPVHKELLAKNVDRFYSAYMPRAEGLEDQNPNPGMCIPVNDSQPNTTTVPFETRTKDSEIYGATIEDRVRLISPTPAKNLGQIQRAFVLGIENIDPLEDRTFRLVIANQPGNDPVLDGDPSFLDNARASWRQLPFGPLFDTTPVTGDPVPDIEEFLTVPAESTDYISLFVVAPSPGEFGPSPITIYAYDDADLLVAEITVNGETEAGELIDPGTISNVNVEEIHNPGLILPVWEDLTVDQLNPAFRNPSLRNPNFRNPNFRNLDYQDPSLRNPRLRNPNMRNETTEATNVQNPTLRNPSLRNEATTDSFIDVTFGIEGNNNTITATDADFAFAGDEFDMLDTQLIAWQENEIESLQNCDFGQITENKVIAAANNPSLRNLTVPDIDNNLDASIRFPVGPDEVIKLTLRIFGPRDVLETLTDTTNGPPKLETNLGWVVSSQAANTGETELNPGEEQIVRDVIPPSFNLPDGYTFVAEATGPEGAFVDLTDPSTTTNGDSISAEDGDTAPEVTCIADPDGIPIPLPGTVPVGSTVVSCTAVDTAPVPNVGTWTGNILVEDNTPPTINVPGGNGAILLADPDSAAGTIVDFLAPGGFNGNSVTVTELVSPDDVIFSCMATSSGDTVDSGVYLFPVGNTQVSCTASDLGPCNAANAACVNGVNVSEPVTFTVSVVDGDPPVINDGNALADIVVEATADPMPVAVPNPPFGDEIDENATISRTPSITDFPLGTTSLVWTARDFTGNESTANQDVVIQDTTAPEITVPSDIVVSTSSSAGTAVTFEVETVDVFPVTVDCTPGSGDTFPLGTTNVDCTATDSSGNASGDSFTVTVNFVFGTTGITTNKKTAKSGSSIPLSWAWTDENGTPMDIGAASQTLKVQEGMCPGGVIVAEDPGSSGFRIKSDLSWEYNWQAVDQGGNNLPASNPNSPYCVTVILSENGASIGEQSGEVLLRP